MLKAGYILGEVNPPSCPMMREQVLCRGFNCMMWRWYDPVCERIKPEDRRGYCGLAGKPEREE